MWPCIIALGDAATLDVPAVLPLDSTRLDDGVAGSEARSNHAVLASILPVGPRATSTARLLE
jgi:hypothetical protein